MACREEFVAGRKRERPENGVNPCRGVRNECECFRVCVQKGGESSTCFIEQRLQVVREKVHRIGLHPLAHALLRRQNRPRAGAVATVVQKRKAWGKRPKRALRHPTRLANLAWLGAAL